jgi:hypothetical protein
MSVSQNGWPVLASSSSLLHKWVIPGTGRHFVLRNGSAGFLLAHYILWHHERVEAISGGVWDEWGYAYRPIRGQSSGYSNHASGTAADVNATHYPLGLVLMTATRAARIRVRLRRVLKGTIRWGGDYLNRKDQMHFEVNAPLSTCEALARQLMDTPRGRRILEANPGQRQVILS